ncbi:MAG: hypothetical protein AAF242_11405 [Bacteroidota bacterium]
MRKHPKKEFLSSPSYRLPIVKAQDERIAKVHDYILHNFRKKITLEDLSTLVSLTPSVACVSGMPATLALEACASASSYASEVV